MLTWGWRRMALAFLAGLVSVLALSPVNFFPAMFISLPVLVWLIDGASGAANAGLAGRLRPAFATGWSFGFGYFVGGLWWLGAALLVEADAFAWALPLAVLGLPALLAIFYGLAAALARLFWSDGFGRIAILAAAFGLIEFAREFLLSGFPWNALGMTLMPTPLMMQPAALVGLDGMTVLAIYIFASPALLATRRGALPGIVLGVLLFAGCLGFSWWHMRTAPGVNEDAPVFRIVQPNIDQAAKWQPGDREAIFDELLRLTALPPEPGLTRPDIVIWPETAVPFLLTDNPGALARIADTLKTGQTLLAGAVRVENGLTGSGDRYYNSIYMINDNGELVGAVDKAHLVPFGEYLPFEGLLKNFGLETIAQSFGGFSAAQTRNFLQLPVGIAAVPLICYEAIFPSLSEIDGKRGGLLLNLTNDGWFGHTPGPYQHFQQARIRAVEAGLPLIRAANSGISGVFDPFGRTVRLLPLGTKGNIDFHLPAPLTQGNTYKNRQLGFAAIFTIMVLLGFISRKSLHNGRD
nr:apolipoprotein N-acyltransferase [Pseudohoeflea suaedae]